MFLLSSTLLLNIFGLAWEIDIPEHLGMTQKELAVRTGLTPQTIVRIVKGVQPITYVTANLLELSTSVPARFWNNLEAQYRERLAKLAWENVAPISDVRASAEYRNAMVGLLCRRLVTRLLAAPAAPTRGSGQEVSR